MNRRSLRSMGVLAGLVMATWASSAAALSPVVISQASGNDAGPKQEYGGPGHEQSTVTWVQKGDKVYVVNIYMSSKVDEGNWQCKCSSVELSPNALPVTVADQVQLTNNGGDRPCNHPKAATDGNTVVWTYGSDDQNANTQTFVTAVDHMCNTVANRVKVSENNNNNEGAPDIVYNGNGSFTAGYLSTGNNDTSFALGLKLSDLGGGQVALDKTYLRGVVTPSNIGRPTIERIDDQYSLFCAAKGNNRPPEVGVQCAVIDNNSGDIMFKQLIAASQPDQHIYMNQPTLARLDNGYFALHVLESSGQGKINDKKGSNIAHDYILTPGTDSFVVASHEVGLGNYPTHSTICSGAYGQEGRRFFGSYGSAITGNGQPLVQFFDFDNTIKKDPEHNTWVAGWYADSGKLANLYGANPHTQGRDFLRCIGDVPNPGFNQPNGFYPSVKTFFVVPHAGRVPGEDKNAEWLSLVPGWTTTPPAPGAPADVHDVQLGPQGEGNSGSEPPTTSEPPTSTDPGGGDEPSVLTPTSASGCSTSSGTPDSSGLAALAFGIGLALSARRRKGV